MKYLAPFVFGVLLAACGGSSHAPDHGINEAASLPSTPALQPHTWRIITSWIDRRNETMSTLYGNAAAVASARSGGAYPAGAHLSLVTWKRVTDDRWFGAFIPGAVQSVEEVEFPDAHAPVYRHYEGASLAKNTPEPEEAARRTAYIVGKRASIVP